MSLAALLSDQRTKMGFTYRSLSQLSGIDAALLNKYEKGERIPSKSHIEELIRSLQLEEQETKSRWLAERIYLILEDEDYSVEALRVAEGEIKYRKSKSAKQSEALPKSLKTVLDTCDSLKKQWESLKPLNRLQLQKMEEYFNLNYTYESNRIEGNTLTLQETHLVINDGITVGGRSMREHLEAINHSEAVEYLTELVKNKTPFTERILKQIHYLILKGIDRQNAGVYRSIGVRISGSAHIPPEPFALARLMEEVFEYYDTNRKLLHPVVLAAEMHERIVRIHPFVDGNGRTTRLVMNLILLQNGFPIANIKGDMANRLNYYSALENAPKDDKVAFHQLIADTVIQSLDEHIELSR